MSDAATKPKDRAQSELELLLTHTRQSMALTDPDFLAESLPKLLRALRAPVQRLQTGCTGRTEIRLASRALKRAARLLDVYADDLETRIALAERAGPTDGPDER